MSYIPILAMFPLLWGRQPCTDNQVPGPLYNSFISGGLTRTADPKVLKQKCNKKLLLIMYHPLFYAGVRVGVGK